MAFQRRKPEAIGLKASLPGFVEPALASSIDKVPAGDQWIHEIKFDGYRVQVHLANEAAKIFTRRGHDWTHRFKKVARDAWRIKASSAVIDGEIVVPAADGTTDFSVLQNELKGKSASIMLVGFDLLYLNGRDLRKAAALSAQGRTRAGPERHRHPVQRKFRDRRPRDVRARLQARPRRSRLEGPGQRLSDGTHERLDRVKKTCAQRETLTIAGFALDGTKWDGLCVGRRKGDDLVYAGKVDHGFDKVSAADLQKRLKPLIRRTQPYAKRIGHKGIWVEPKLLAEIEYREVSRGKGPAPVLPGPAGGSMMDAFDRFWQWADKPPESSLTTPAELHRAVMEVAPEDRQNRAKVNEAAARATASER